MNEVLAFLALPRDSDGDLNDWRRLPPWRMTVPALVERRRFYARRYFTLLSGCLASVAHGAQDGYEKASGLSLKQILHLWSAAWGATWTPAGENNLSFYANVTDNSSSRTINGMPPGKGITLGGIWKF